jgi:hypothetical protein
MQRGELLVRLNRRAKARYRVAKPITSGVLDDWLEARVVTAPPKRGRRRNWTVRHYRRALEIVRLRAAGVRSLRVIRVCLFLKGYDDAAVFDRGTRNALALEFTKLRNVIVGTIRSTYAGNSSGKDDRWRKSIVLDALGPLDEALRSYVQYAPEESLDGYLVTRFGQGGKDLERAAARLTQALAGSLVGRFAPETFAQLNWKQPVASTLLNGVLGVAGETATPTPTDSIQAASPETFHKAAQKLREIISTLRTAGAARVAWALTGSWRWRILMYVFLVHAIHEGLDSSVERSLKIEWRPKA